MSLAAALASAYGASPRGWAGFLSRADFIADLLYTAVPQRAASGTTATFTRATTSTWPNNDGYLVTGVAGEIGFVGARRVRNLAVASEDFAGAAWTEVRSTLAANSTTAPNGAATATTITSSSALAMSHFLIDNNTLVPSNELRLYSIYVKPSTHNYVALNIQGGVGNYVTKVFDLTSGVVGETSVGGTSGTLTSSEITDEGDGWYRISMLAKITSAGTRNFVVFFASAASGNTINATGDISIASTAGTEAFYLWGFQLEDVTAQTTQTAGEYVSVGALDYRSTQDPLYLSLPGTAGHYASTPDSVANSITGDIDIRVKVALNDYTPTVENVFVCKNDAANNMAYYWILNGAGTLSFITSTDGTAAVSATSTASTGITDGAVSWIRVTRDVDNGAGGNTTVFYKSSDGVTWTKIGADVVNVGTTSIYDSAAPLALGMDDRFNAYILNGKIYRAQIYNGIDGTLAVDFNPHRDATTPTGTITSSTTGEVWTINGASSVIRSDYYHGSFVDGVKCFPTDLSGNPLTTMLGYVAEGARTNLCLQSNTFTTTWVDVSATLSPVQNVVGPDGATSAWTFNDDSAVFREEVAQDIVLTAAAHTYSVFVKKTTGAQTGYPVLWATTGGTTISLCTIDTTNGVATVWTAYTGLSIAGSSSARCVSYNDNFWRVSLTFTGTAATWSHRITPAGTTNATQATGVMDAAAQASHVFYGAQVELGSFASSYIATTTIAVARNADVLTYSSAGNISDTAGWCSAEYQSPVITTVNAMGLVANAGGGSWALATRIITSGAQIYDGVNNAFGPTGIPVDNALTKACSTWGGGSSQVAVNGVSGTAASYDGTLSMTSLLIATPAGSLNQFFGTIRNVRIGQRQLSASELQAITS